MGTTPQSSNILNLINSLIYQLSRIFEMKSIAETNFSSKILQKDFFLNLLKQIIIKFPTRKIIIVLDSIDQLNYTDYTLDWFIDELPPNVKMIYSTLTGHAGIFTHLKTIKRLSNNENFIQISSLNTELANVIIQDWLRMCHRRITPNQLELVNQMFEQTRELYPLYVKIIFDLVSKWTSFYQPDVMFVKADTIDKCINYLFTELEKIHGRLLFSHSVFYLTVFKNGISDNEIEDILSLDDEVLYDIFEFHAPPVRF